MKHWPKTKYSRNELTGYLGESWFVPSHQLAPLQTLCLALQCLSFQPTPTHDGRLASPPGKLVPAHTSAWASQCISFRMFWRCGHAQLLPTRPELVLNTSFCSPADKPQAHGPTLSQEHTASKLMKIFWTWCPGICITLELTLKAFWSLNVAVWHFNTQNKHSLSSASLKTPHVESPVGYSCKDLFFIVICVASPWAFYYSSVPTCK